MKTIALLAATLLTSCIASIDPTTGKATFTLDPDTTHAVLESMISDFNPLDKPVAEPLHIVEEAK